MFNNNTYKSIHSREKQTKINQTNKQTNHTSYTRIRTCSADAAATPMYRVWIYNCRTLNTLSSALQRLNIAKQRVAMFYFSCTVTFQNVRCIIKKKKKKKKKWNSGRANKFDNRAYNLCPKTVWHTINEFAVDICWLSNTLLFGLVH